MVAEPSDGGQSDNQLSGACTVQPPESPAFSSARAPLPEASLLAHVDLLTRADEPHEHAPAGDALAEVDERLGLALGEVQALLGRDLLHDPAGPLRLVVDDDVLRRHRLAVAEVLLHVVLDVAYEGLAAAAGAAQFVPRRREAQRAGLDRLRGQRPHPREVVGGGRLAVRAAPAHHVHPQR